MVVRKKLKFITVLMMRKVADVQKGNKRGPYNKMKPCDDNTQSMADLRTC